MAKIDKMIEFRVKELMKLATAYKGKSVDEIIETITKHDHWSDGKHGQKEKKLFRRMWTESQNSMNRKNLYEQEEGNELTWDDLLQDMQRDLGEFTDISGYDFNYLKNWLKNKIVDKKITN